MTLADTLLDFPTAFRGPPIEEFKAAVTAEATNEFPPPLDNLAGRIIQARQKIDNEDQIASMSDLLTTAQFGAGSIGSAIAHISGAPESAPVCEAVCVARFLIATSVAAENAPHLFPRDLGKRINLNLENTAWPATQPLHEELQNRAADILDRHLSRLPDIRQRDFRKAMILETALLQKKIQRLQGRNPSDVKVGLTWFDRLRIRLRGIGKT